MKTVLPSVFDRMATRSAASAGARLNTKKNEVSPGATGICVCSAGCTEGACGLDTVKKGRGRGSPSTQKHAYRHEDVPTKTDTTDVLVVRHADANTTDTGKTPKTHTHGHTRQDI